MSLKRPGAIYPNPVLPTGTDASAPLTTFLPNAYLFLLGPAWQQARKPAWGRPLLYEICGVARR